MSVPAHPRTTGTVVRTTDQPKTTGTVVRTFGWRKTESFLDKIHSQNSGLGVRVGF